MEIMKKMKSIGGEDQRKYLHSIKFASALILVSLLYYGKPLYDGFEERGVWAVLTVVFVFESTVGATISKSINRGFATLLAGSLGVAAKYFSSLCGETGEPVAVGILIFLLGAGFTYMRFHPKVKRRYDYGVVIFILTFTLVVVSGDRMAQIIQVAHQRLSTILIGVATCMILSIFVYPAWAGKDLHNLIGENINKLASSLEGLARLGGEICNSSEDENIRVCSETEDSKDETHLQSHKSVLNSKQAEETLANLAWWEPCHGPFKFRHPWKEYLNVGVISRECACLLEALSCCINSTPQAHASEVELKVQSSCNTMIKESSEALKELASAVKNSTCPLSTAAESHIQMSKAAADEATKILKNSLLPTNVVPLFVVASYLTEIIKRIEKMSECIHDFSEKAGFQKPEHTTVGSDHVMNIMDDDDDCVVIGSRVTLRETY